MKVNKILQIFAINLLVIAYSYGSNENEETNDKISEVRNKDIKKQRMADTGKGQQGESNKESENNESNRKKISKIKLGCFAASAFSFATLVAYKKNKQAKKSIDKAIEKSQDYIICNILCPVLIKWELLKEEKFTKQDGAIVLLCSGATLGAYLLYKNFK